MGRRKTKHNKLVGKGEFGRSMLTRKTTALNQQQKMESVHAVFNNPMLMDNIIKYSIYETNGKEINIPTIVGLRLVNMNWLQSTSRVLAKSGEWLINFPIGYNYGASFLNKQIFDISEKPMLEHFVSVFSKASRSFNSVLPMRLAISQYYFVKENDANLKLTFFSNFLEQCSDLICELSLEYPIDGDSMALTCTELNFAILQDLNFHFETWKDPCSLGPRTTTSDSNANGLKLLQQILQNSPNLQRVTFLNDDKAAVNTSSIMIPTAIKCLTFAPDPVTENELALVTNNQLPKLNTLNLDIMDQIEMNVTYKILQHFQQQLRNLSLDVRDTDDETRICLKLPLMEKLKHFKVSGQNYYLSSEQRQGWSKLVPNLTHLVLKNITATLFLECVQGCQFENVKKFKFSLIETDYKKPNIVSPNIDILNEIFVSSPNIEKLSLRYNFSEISSLKYIFQNFTHLKKLTLKFNRVAYDSAPGFKVVSVFLGISLELATALGEKSVEDVNIPVDNPESIMNLKELESLTLKTEKLDYDDDAEEDFYSDIIAEHGLDEMPKLEKMKLFARFKH